MKKLALIDISSLLYDEFVNTYDIEDSKIPSSVLHGLSQVYFLDSEMLLMSKPTKKKLVTALETCIGQITPSWRRYFEDFADTILSHDFDTIPSKLAKIMSNIGIVKFTSVDFDITDSHVIKLLQNKFPCLNITTNNAVYIDINNHECIQEFVRSTGNTASESVLYDLFHSLLFSIHGVNFNRMEIHSLHDIK